MALTALSACQPVEKSSFQESFSSCTVSDIILLPHHALVEDWILALYASVDRASFDKIIVLSPNHFSTGPEAIARPSEQEHGYSLHEKWSTDMFPGVEVEGWMLKTPGSPEALEAFAQELSRAIDEDNALLVFSIDFSHYLPGEIALLHDLRSADIVESRSIEEAASLEIDSPATAELLLRVLEEQELSLEVLKNTNPSLDIGHDSFENTTHLFGCSSPATPLARQVFTQSFFAHPREWYEGKTGEDRYLYGTDEAFFDQGGQDHAIVKNAAGEILQEFTFDYFD
ncbi:MAG: hypothetical protein WC777_02215 [Candidatus Gracilibacteria bacterium]